MSGLSACNAQAEKKRKKFTAEEKIVILKKHLLEKKAISDICDEHGVHPTMFYRWQDYG